MPTLKIAHVVESGGGGVARHILDLCAGQLANGHALTIVYAPARAEPAFLAGIRELRGVRIRQLGMWRSVGWHDIRSRRQLTRLIESEGPFDVLHGHSSKAGALVRLLPTRLPGVRVYTSHALRTMDPTLGKPARVFYGTIERVLTNYRCDALIVGSQQERQAALDIRVAPSRIALVLNGIVTPTLPSRAEARALLKLPADPDISVIGFVGRFVHQKAPERAVRALAAMRNPGAYLALLGDGDLEGRIRAVAGELGIADRVIIHSGLDGQYHMPAFDVLLVPSRYESMGYVFLEAAAAGIPIVSTPVGVAEDVIRPGLNGSIVPNTDAPQPFAAELQKWLDSAKRLTKGKVARSGGASITAEAMVDATLSVYSRALMQVGPRRSGAAIFKKA